MACPILKKLLFPLLLMGKVDYVKPLIKGNNHENSSESILFLVSLAAVH